MTTQYPGKIDNNTSLPDAVDNLTPVKADVVNRLKQAIIAIENELGTKPSGIYSTLKARLTGIEDSINNLEIIQIAKDIGGTVSEPLVVGLQGNPLSSSAPSAGEVLAFNGLVWAPTTLSGPPGSFTADGDLSGNSLSQTVIGLQGRSVLDTAPLDGYVLAWSTSSNAWHPSTVDYSKLGTGLQNIGAQQFTSTVDAYGTIIDVQPKNIQTGNATATTLDSFTIPSNCTLIISAVITGIKSDNSQGAAYFRSAAFRNTGGSVSQISTTQDGGTFEDDSAWDATIDNSTTTIRIRVTGKAATTIRWTCVTTRLQVIY